MAIMDAENQFSDNQAVTAAAASENVIDLGIGRDIGVGDPDLYLVILVTETSDDAGDNSTLAVSLETDDNEAFASATKVADLITLPANVAAGTQYVIPVPTALLAAYERYIRLKYTPANGDLSAGKFSAFLTLDATQYTQYASGTDIA